MSDVVVTRSKGVHLPNEAWLEILDNSSDYPSCIRAMRVCKGFQAIMKSRQFDGRLFRLPASATTLKKGDTIELHPVISAIHELETDPEEVTILAYSGEYNITRLPAIDDFATSPAAKVIRLDFQLPMQPLVKLKNDAGVTVKQVVWGYCKLWGRKPPPHFTNWDDTPCEDWIQTLEDHSGFPGFSPLKIRKDGSVVLGADARYFDS